ncbi:hypothetical protein QQZ08_002099 [Neonectria magnoliae]|uniref:Uncharacterized protein n=1 Tax=Neonectria magnoliae TaxID=2732573 RepID=A0ABR1IEP2_9HYPO
MPLAAEDATRERLNAPEDILAETAMRLEKAPDARTHGATDKSKLAKATPAQSNATIQSSTPGRDRSPSPRRLGIDNRDSVPDATVNIRAWFVNLNVFHTPILVREAADAAFATRFRQAINGPLDPQPKHMLRVNYASNEELLSLAESEVSWPSQSRSKLLIEVSLKYVSRGYHIVRRSSVLADLEQSIRNPMWGDSLLRCKFWALFAVGELYSARSIASEKDFPGMAYFAKAAKMLGVLDERPGIDSVEIMNILVSDYHHFGS